MQARSRVSLATVALLLTATLGFAGGALYGSPRPSEMLTPPSLPLFVVVVAATEAPLLAAGDGLSPVTTSLIIDRERGLLDSATRMDPGTEGIVEVRFLGNESLSQRFASTQRSIFHIGNGPAVKIDLVWLPGFVHLQIFAEDDCRGSFPEYGSSFHGSSAMSMRGADVVVLHLGDGCPADGLLLQREGPYVVVEPAEDPS